ncbi:helix-turn-helix transcriptional regulator [Streptomyces sp. NPDC005408]|uniref:helix-turn-helix domain-containing protein n=1 Tax=Streptomyces sp. NPDC005408 TaxID=3155341 RepID=UPI0033A40FD1
MATTKAMPTALQLRLGRQLAVLRDGAGKTWEEAAAHLGVHPGTIRRLELAQVKPKVMAVRPLLELYGATREQIADFMEQVKQANTAEWWHDFRDVLPDGFGRFVSLEGAASLIRAYEPHSIPALLQTEAYARALLSMDHPDASQTELERRVELVLERQRHCLTGRVEPTVLWVVMEETAVRKSVGGAAVMGPQIERLIADAALPNIQLQILPHASGAYSARQGQFSLFRFDTAPELPDNVYVDNLTGGEYLDEKTSAYIQSLDRMSAEAAPLDVSPAFLRDIHRELWAHPAASRRRTGSESEKRNGEVA